MSMEQKKAPSIGSKELGFDARGNRVRQIVERPVLDLSSLQSILTRANMFGEPYGVTRSLVRVIINHDLVEQRVCDYVPEASIPLTNTLPGHDLIYYGKNSVHRATSDETIAAEKALVEKLLQKQPKSPSQILEQAKNQGFQLQRLQGSLAPQDYGRLIEMYEASFTDYPFDIEEAIKYMVGDPSYQVYAARSAKDNQLAAVCVTEQVTLDLGNGSTFVMREMGDSAKMPEANGLNAPLKLMLVHEALKDGVDLVFCESRAALGAVNSINQSIGMKYAGFLPQSTRIDGQADIQEVDLNGQKTKYGNMNVWALNGDDIKKIGMDVQVALIK